MVCLSPHVGGDDNTEKADNTKPTAGVRPEAEDLPRTLREK